MIRTLPTWEKASKEKHKKMQKSQLILGIIPYEDKVLV
jgi:hypothetical protein